MSLSFYKHMTCPRCGKSEETYPLKDARGISCGLCCEKCEGTLRAKYRPEIFSDGAYEADEAIEEEDRC